MHNQPDTYGPAQGREPMLAAVTISEQSVVLRGQQVSKGRGPFLINGDYLARRLAQLIGATHEEGYEFVAKINRPNGPYIEGNVLVNDIHRQDFVLVSRAVSKPEDAAA